MIKFDNKLELRYSFNDKSSYMDAWVIAVRKRYFPCCVCWQMYWT